MSKGDWVYATRPFGYNGQELDRSQVFMLAGARNDEKLLRLGYCNPTGKMTVYRCGECNAGFVDMQARANHGQLRHPNRPTHKTPMDEDADFERQERLANELNPLKLENTEASRRG